MQIRSFLIAPRCIGSFATGWPHELPTGGTASGHASPPRGANERECILGAQSARPSPDRCPDTPLQLPVQRMVPVRAAQVDCRLSSPATETDQCRWLRCFSDAGSLSIRVFQRTSVGVQMIAGPLRENRLHLSHSNCSASLASTPKIPERKINENG